MKSFYWILFLVLIVGNVYVYKTIFAPPILAVHVLDVGKGDAILIRNPDGKTLLIDAGPDASILRALGSVLPMWERSIDAVIMTSKAASSAGGLSDVMDRYHTGNLIRSGTRGQRLVLGGGTYVDILWPPETPTAMNTANSTLVLRISYGKTSFLIQNNLPPRISAWLAAMDRSLPPPNLTISSSTPKGVYISDGNMISTK